MLREVLRIAQQTGTVQLATLAQELDVNERLVQQVLNELTVLGYLQLANGEGANTECARCPLRSACLYRQQAQLWTITEKGQRFLSKVSSE